MATWIDTAIGWGIAGIGLFILYRALKEPMDMMFGAIGRGIKGIMGMFSGGDDSGGYEEIVYG